MNKEFIVPTGRIIKEYLEEYEINQKELSSRTGISEKHISNVMNGNCRLTEEFALKLEKIIPNVKAEYWLNYESKYREYIARQKELKCMDEEMLLILAKRFHFKEVFRGLGLSLIEEAIEMLKLLRISDFTQFDVVYDKILADFMEDGGEKEAIAIWLNMCRSEIEIQNKDLTDIEYNEKDFRNNLNKFKILAMNEKTELSINSSRKLCNKLGVYLVFCEPIKHSKVRGAITSYKGKPVIYISGRFKTHAHIWFALMHEIGHLLLHYDKRDTIVSIEDDSTLKELEANKFAQDFFINPLEYKSFINSGIFTKETIIEFSREQKILPKFIVARLQHDKIIEYSAFAYL